MRVFRIPAIVLLVLAAGCAASPDGPGASTLAAPSSLRCESGVAAAGLSLPYVWQRDTMVIDLRGLAGDGECVLRRAGAEGWPERIALRVVPGITPALEVLADQRLSLPASEGPAGSTVDLELPHALHSPATPEILVRWGTRLPTPR